MNFSAGGESANLHLCELSFAHGLVARRLPSEKSIINTIWKQIIDFLGSHQDLAV